jgi:hypothetical protein
VPSNGILKVLPVVIVTNWLRENFGWPWLRLNTAGNFCSINFFKVSHPVTSCHVTEDSVCTFSSVHAVLLMTRIYNLCLIIHKECGLQIVTSEKLKSNRWTALDIHKFVFFLKCIWHMNALTLALLYSGYWNDWLIVYDRYIRVPWWSIINVCRKMFPKVICAMCWCSIIMKSNVSDSQAHPHFNIVSLLRVPDWFTLNWTNHSRMFTYTLR